MFLFLPIRIFFAPIRPSLIIRPFMIPSSFFFGKIYFQTCIFQLHSIAEISFRLSFFSGSSMVLNPNLVFYSCIARGSTILAQFSREPNLEALALQCIEKTPLFHSIYSHTIRKRTYTFLISHPFVYFGIFDEELRKSDGLWFLNRIKSAFEEIISSRSLLGSDNFTPYCFQAQFDLVFQEIMALSLDLLGVLAPVMVDDQSSVDPARGKKTVLAPLIEKPSNGLKKKKRLVGEENGKGGKDVTMDNNVDVYDDVNGIGGKDFSLLMQKNISYMGERQKAKQIWKKHVWVVLLFDLFVCMVLFAVWLWVCRGFQCIDR